MGDWILRLSTKPKMVGWIAFWLSVILTWLAYLYAWMVGPYYVLLSALGIISLCLGLWVLKESRFAWHSTVLVVLGLLIGQWWLIEFLVAQVLWGSRGFAP